ncbi:MAG: WG repeat-containing protein, partial [Thermosynechococcaceae cyanobacterium]
FSDGLAKIPLPNNRIGFIDKTGAVALRLPFTAVTPFWQGLAIAHNKNDKIGLIDKTGKFIIQPQFDYSDGEMAPYFKPTFPNGLELMNIGGGLGDKQTQWIGGIIGGKWQYLNKQGQVVIEQDCLVARPFSEGLAAINEADTSDGERIIDHWGFINTTGKRVIPTKFDYVESFSEGRAIAGVKSLNKNSDPPFEYFAYGYINRRGTFVIPAQFQQATPFFEGLAAVAVDGKYGYINKTGKFVIPPQFETAFPFVEHRARVSTAAGVGYINKKGGYIVKPQFGSDSQDFSEGLAVVQIQ